MLRQLLALLAVLSGLTVAVQPAQALSAGVESVSFASDVASCQDGAEAIAGRAVDRLQSRSDREKFCSRPVITVAVPTVMLQADRARE